MVTVYDKALEYISGGSNVPEIKEFFWKWRRNHNRNTEFNLNRMFRNVLLKGKKGMSNIGAFGASVADDPFASNLNGRVQLNAFGASRDGKARMMMKRSSVATFAAAPESEVTIP